MHGISGVKCFLWASVLKKHLKVHAKEKPHSCNGFENLQNLKVDQKIHNAVRECKSFECEKTFTSATCTKLHERIHPGENPYKCFHCDKRFSHSSHRKTHERIHTGENPYKYSHCDEIQSVRIPENT